MRPTQPKFQPQDPLGSTAISDGRWDSKLTDRTAGKSFRERAQPARDLILIIDRSDQRIGE